jgi:endonuclease YncB( thermonuclease family)
MSSPLPPVSRTCRLPLILLIAVILQGPPPVAAAGLRAHGQVTAFDDGDSFELRLSSRTTVAIRLHAIDAPELVQRHGEAARRALSDVIAGRTVRVECYKRDPRGRHVCRAWAGDEDLQLHMLQQGHAWHFTMYLDEQSIGERSGYARAQARARAARRGLWAQARPMPPWDCRNELRRLRTCQ